MEDNYVKGFFKSNVFIFKCLFFVKEEIYYVNIIFFIEVVNSVCGIDVE